MDDLFKALQMFQSGVQQAATTAAVNDATQAMQQIQTQITDEAQQRQQLQQLGNQLALRMVGVGAQPAHIEQAFKAVSPQQFASPEAAITQGMLTGNKGLTELGTQAQDVLFRKQAKQAGLQMQMQEASDERRFQREYALQMLKMSPEMAKAKSLTADEVNKIAGLDESLDAASRLLSKVNQNANLVGPLAGNIPFRDQMDPEFAAFKSEVGKFFDQYRIAVTGAGASEGELKMLEKRMPSESDRPEAFKAKLKSAMELGESIRNRRIKSLGLAGRDIKGFVEQRKQEETTKAQQQQNMQFMQQFILGR